MRRRGDEAEDWDGQSRRRPAPYGSQLAEFICLMLFLLSRSRSGPWGRRQAELCPQLRPHHRKTGERLIVKSVLQKLFRLYQKASGVRRVRFLLLWQGCALQRGSL